MCLLKLGGTWLDGCRQLAAYDENPAYRRLSWLQRKRLDHRVVVILLATQSFWRATFFVAVATVCMHVITWHLDLTGAPRDALRSLPLLAAFPILAGARKRILRSQLRNREVPHRQVGADV